MKNTKKCPKCGSDDIMIVDGYTGAYGSGNNIQLGLTALSSVLVDRYICMSCGFSEEWIRENDLEKLRNSKKCHR